MKVEAADPKVSGELLFPPPYGIIGIVIRFKSSLRRSTTLRQPASRQEGRDTEKERCNGENKRKRYRSVGDAGVGGGQARGRERCTLKSTTICA